MLVSRARLPWLLLPVFVALLPVQDATAQTRKVHNVLTIHSGAVDYAPNTTVDAGIRHALVTKPGETIEYFTEYLEFDRFDDAQTSGALSDYILRKYKGYRIDVVIAITKRSLRFVLEQRASLFPTAIIVSAAAGISRDDLAPDLRRLFAGVRVGNAYAQSLKLAMQLHPDARRVYVVAVSPDRASQQAVRDELLPLADRIPMTFVTARSLHQLLATVRAIPRGSLILYIWYQNSGQDYVSNPEEPARLVAAAAQVPVYGVIDSLVGAGIVGGMVRDTRGTGLQVGQIVRRVLDGTPPQSIPLGYAPMLPLFDWRQVQRWDIDAARLPRGAAFRFKAPTVWESYGRYVIGAFVVMAAQLLLIAGLLTQRSSRQRAEMALVAREAALRTSFRRIRRMAGHMINAQESARTQIARDLHDDVCQGLVAISMTVSGLKRLPAIAQDRRVKQSVSQLERAVLETVDSVRRLSHDLHPASLRLIGLVAALKGHCAETEKRHDVQVSLQTRGEFADVSPDISVCVFRIVQESLRNGIMHGAARRLTVSLARRDGTIDLTVCDDGRGFDLAAVQHGGDGLGLVSIEERAHVVGGRAEIITQRNSGTTIHVQVPVAPTPAAATDEVPGPRRVSRRSGAPSFARSLAGVHRGAARPATLLVSTRHLVAAARAVTQRIGGPAAPRSGANPSRTSVESS